MIKKHREKSMCTKVTQVLKCWDWTVVGIQIKVSCKKKNLVIEVWRWEGKLKARFVEFVDMEITSALLFSGCYNKLQQTGGLRQQTFISHSSGVWEAQDLGTSRFGVWWGLCSWFSNGHLLAVPSHGGEQRKEAQVLLSLHRRHCPR